MVEAKVLFRRREFTVPKTSHRGRLFTPAFRSVKYGEEAPALIVFDLDACLWTPEMFELGSRPTMYDAARGGVKAGGDTVKLFPGAMAVLKRLLVDEAFASTKVAGHRRQRSRLSHLRVSHNCPSTQVALGRRRSRISYYRQIYPGSKGGSTSQPCTRSLRSRLIRCSSSTTARTATIAETLHAGARGRPVFGRPTGSPSTSFRLASTLTPTGSVGCAVILEDTIPSRTRARLWRVCEESAECHSVCVRTHDCGHACATTCTSTCKVVRTKCDRHFESNRCGLVRGDRRHDASPTMRYGTTVQL